MIDEIASVTDHIVTAKPEAHVDFAIAICKLAGAITDDGMAEYYRHFYKGNRIARPATIPFATAPKKP